MRIYRPVLTNYKTQNFGNNKACVYSPTGGPTRPYKIVSKTGATCPVGYRDFYMAIGMKGHNGEDWKTYYKEPVHFPVDCGDETKWSAESELDHDGGIGLDVRSLSSIAIDTLPPQTGPDARALWKQQGGKLRVMFRFWHGQSNVIKSGPVSLGQLMQLSNSTGASSGNHCHFAMKFIDVEGNTLDTDNGYTGAVDFSHWFENTFILDALKAKQAAASAASVATSTPTPTTASTTIQLPEPSLWARLFSLLVALLARLNK